MHRIRHERVPLSAPLVITIRIPSPLAVQSIFLLLLRLPWTDSAYDFFTRHFHFFTFRSATLRRRHSETPQTPPVRTSGPTPDPGLDKDWRRLRTLKTLPIDNGHSNTEQPTYKCPVGPIWTRGLRLWGNAEKSYSNRIQAFRNIALRQSTNSSPYRLKSSNCKRKSNNILYTTVPHSSHSNPLILPLSTIVIAGNPPRRSKRKSS